MILMNLDLTPYYMVRTPFKIFIYVLTSMLLAFWYLMFFYQRDSSTKVVSSLHSFGAQILDFPSNFQISFRFIGWLYAHSISNRCGLNIYIIQHAPISKIRRPSNSGNRSPYTGSFIQCVNCRET